MLGLAGGALALPPRFNNVRRRPAIGAEFVPGVPFENALGCSQDRQILTRQDGAERAQFVEAADAFERARIGDVDGEMRGAARIETEKQERCIRWRNAGAPMRTQPPQRDISALLDDERPVLMKRNEPRVGRIEGARQPISVTSAMASTVAVQKFGMR